MGWQPFWFIWSWAVGGTSVLFLGHFDEFCAFTDLTYVEAAFDEKRLRVEAKKLLGGWD